MTTGWEFKNGWFPSRPAATSSAGNKDGKKEFKKTGTDHAMAQPLIAALNEESRRRGIIAIRSNGRDVTPDELAINLSAVWDCLVPTPLPDSQILSTFPL
jgi:hypothetical protein